MLVARYKAIVTIPKQWEHDPTLKDYSGYTVAMTLNGRGYIIPE